MNNFPLSNHRNKVVVLVVIASALIGLIVMRYDFTSPGWRAGEKAAEVKNVEMCSRIINVSIFGPSTAMRRAQCIRTYAEITKDPSACELLMPSEYGWSCLNAAIDYRLCIIKEGSNDTVRGQGKITTYNECISGPDEIKNYSCCVMARILNEQDNSEKCSSLKTPELRDECHYFSAQNKKENEECNTIESVRLRSACEVAVRALRKR